MIIYIHNAKRYSAEELKAAHYVGRWNKKFQYGSALANPYTVEEHGRAQAVALYQQNFRLMYNSSEGARKEYWALVHELEQNGQLALVCWCTESKIDMGSIEGQDTCHAEVIARFVLQTALKRKAHSATRV